MCWSIQFVRMFSRFVGGVRTRIGFRRSSRRVTSEIFHRTFTASAKVQSASASRSSGVVHYDTKLSAEILVRQIPAFSDNYIHFVHHIPTQRTAVVDPGDAEPVLTALNAWSKSISQFPRFLRFDFDDRCVMWCDVVSCKTRVAAAFNLMYSPPRRSYRRHATHQTPFPKCSCDRRTDSDRYWPHTGIGGWCIGW